MNNNSKINTKEILDEKILRSSDLIESTGMTYRQINDWQSKGVLPDERKSNKKWRTFTSREVFVMMVCKEIRDKFGVPLESLNFIQRCMLKKEANHFNYAFDMMLNYGFAIYLLTDFKDTFIMDTDLEMEDLFKLGFFRDDDPEQYIFLKINPLINKMLEMKNLPQLKINRKIYESIYESMIEAVTLQRNISSQEKEVLELIRNKSFKRVTVHLKHGKMFQVDTEEELADELKDKNNRDLLNIIESNDFQSITIQKQDNKIVRLTRTIPRKLRNKK